MQFGVLGPLAVTTDAGEPVVVPGTKVRVLLADLLANRNQVVSADRLIDDLWGDDAARQRRPARSRCGSPSCARRSTTPSRAPATWSSPARPATCCAPATVDADRFAELADATDAGRLTAALALWRGEPYADVADEEFARAEATRLAEQRLAVLERLADARLARGEHDLVAADLAELVARHPLREGLRALHLRALYAAGRQSEALDSYAELRDRLADELGLDPGPELVALHRKILAQDAGLSAPPMAAPDPQQPAGPAGRAGRPGRGAGRAARPDPGQRLVTLVGPGGVGKTRLAVGGRPRAAGGVAPGRAGRRSPPARPGWPSWCSAELGHPRGGRATGVRRPTGCVAALRQRQMLLVLDNCEHVIEPVAALVARLLRDAPGVRVLATSREPLGADRRACSGRCRRWPCRTSDGDLDAVHGGRPRPGCSPPGPPRSSAASGSTSGPRPRWPSSAAGWTVCRWPWSWPRPGSGRSACRAWWTGWTTGSRLLTTQQRDVPPRQRTLTAVIGWSWDLLDDAERAVLARLAVFQRRLHPGGGRSGLRRRPGRAGPAGRPVAGGDGRRGRGAALPAAGVGRRVLRWSA